MKYVKGAVIFSAGFAAGLAFTKKVIEMGLKSEALILNDKYDRMNAEFWGNGT